ncbi:MAG: DUF2892 domain-containing protein [Flavobacterium psychrophilum]|nr:MAG: DUF2892 domain-containing protein [Flavobacterium psychrophilum]
MKRNMGVADRIIRVLLAALLVYLSYSILGTGVVSIVLLLISIVFVLTSLTGFCPLYRLVGINTCRMKKQRHL